MLLYTLFINKDFYKKSIVFLHFQYPQQGILK